jgi:hypothetical protein
MGCVLCLPGLWGLPGLMGLPALLRLVVLLGLLMLLEPGFADGLTVGHRLLLRDGLGLALFLDLAMFLETLQVVQLAIQGAFIIAALALGCGEEAGGGAFRLVHVAQGDTSGGGGFRVAFPHLFDATFEEGCIQMIHAAEAPKGLGNAEGRHFFGRRAGLIGVFDFPDEGIVLGLRFVTKATVAAKD